MALPFECPNLGVSVNINDDGSFAARLDAAIQRSNGHSAPSGQVIEHDRSEIAEPPTFPPLARRRF